MSKLHGEAYLDYYRNVRKWDPHVKGRWQQNYAEMIETAFGLAAHGRRVLDLGCAGGSQASAMRDAGIDVWGVEPEEVFVARSPFENMRARMLLGDARVIPFRDWWFDFVHCSQVLEHLRAAEMHVALAEIRRVLRPGGTLFASMPMGCPSDYPNDDVTHETIVPRAQWIEWLLEAGFLVDADPFAALEDTAMYQLYRWHYVLASTPTEESA